MQVLKRWRFHLTDNGDFILTGVGRYNNQIRVLIRYENIQYAKMDTSYLQINLKNKVTGYILYFKEADMSKAIAPMRAVKRQPKQFTIDAVYCMMAEVSIYLCGLTDEVNKDYLKNTKPLNIFFNASSDDGVDFNLDIAVDILLKTGADKIISHMDK